MGAQSLSIGLLGLKLATYTDKWKYVCLNLIVQTRHASSYNQDTSGLSQYCCKYEQHNICCGEKLRISDMKNHPACSAGVLFGRANVISSRSFIRSAMFDL